MKPERLETIFEFLLFGIVVGVIEDLIVARVVSGDPITWQVVGIVVLIAIPFAILGEVFVDNVDFVSLYRKLRGHKPQSTVGKYHGLAPGERQIMLTVEAQGKIKNNDVQALLGVSDATATRYLEELESNGYLNQAGAAGRGVYYTVNKTAQNGS